MVTRFIPVVLMVIVVGMTLMTTRSSVEAAENTVEIVAHRGASYDAPENTLASVKLGWQQNADGVEFDVWLSKDGQLVVIHDKDTARTGDVKKNVIDHTAAELRQVDVGRWKDAKFAGERVPLLAEVLATIPSGKRVFIEMKCGTEGVPELSRVVAVAGRPAAETAIISFHDDVIAASKRALPQCQAYWIVGLKQDKETGKWPHSAESLIRRAKEIHADGLDLQAADLIDRSFGDQVKSAGLKLLVWTVNDVGVARKMIAAGVEGITTDRPGWLREQLQKP